MEYTFYVYTYSQHGAYFSDLYSCSLGQGWPISIHMRATSFVKDSPEGCMCVCIYQKGVGVGGGF